MSGLHKKTKSTVSLRSLVNGKDNKQPSYETRPTLKMKKSKSSTSLSAILSRKSSRGRKEAKDKENQSPYEPYTEPSSPWPQNFPQPLQDLSEMSNILQSRQRTLDQEVALYTPSGDLSPSKQRNFHDYFSPSLSKNNHQTTSPMLSSDSRPIRKASDESQQSQTERGSFFRSKRPGHERSMSSNASSTVGGESSRGRTTEPRKSSTEHKKKNRGSLVMAAVSAFNSRSSELEKTMQPSKQKPQELENEFEALLEARNIPHDTRAKMRTMDMKIKADFVRQNRVESGSSNGSASGLAGFGTSSKKTDLKGSTYDKDSTKETRRSKSRPRSWNFTLSKGDISPVKKQKGDGTLGHNRGRSVEIPRSLGPLNTGPLSPAAQLDASADPDDFVHYLREVQKPEIVEVGKLHKLRILLRNEKVAWVDAFISIGGMDEVIGLIYRIIKVEWREEHEDNLLHETLLCLKALCTTSLALSQLDLAGPTLFPTLLGMLFDEEKKGPSEFTTRGIIMSLLFAHLSAAPPDCVVERARTILTYLRDPIPSEENRPVTFIADIYQSRPYRVWCKEVSNVTKEVFWIFLHHLNVIPIANRVADNITHDMYAKTYFPAARPPVPAAPYVGGVEWDATNYLASHLDIINGVIASLPTRDERNKLRSELRASGFEKCMGATMRTCKEKFYGSVHEGLKTWVAAAAIDGWDFRYVREGPSQDERSRSPVKSRSPQKEQAPKLDIPLVLEGSGGNAVIQDSDGWL